MKFFRDLSLRSQLLLGILLPVVMVIGLNTVGLYRQALHSLDTAYDRTLLASAKSIGELLRVEGVGKEARLQASVLYAALEPFEADNRSHMYYKVTGFNGEVVLGYQDLPAWRGQIPDRSLYAALVDFYDDHYQGEPVRVAVLLQPVPGPDGHGMAVIQVAETLEIRHTLARHILIDTLWRQAALVIVIVLLIVAVVQVATRPVREISARLKARPEGDLGPVERLHMPSELQPLVEATNEVLSRLNQLLEHQKRFVRNTAHQLRTPLAVLKTQVQSALRGDQAPLAALHDINHTVARATQLANQMLTLAKVEQLRQQNAPVVDWSAIIRAVALDLSALLAARQIDFSIETVPAFVQAPEWTLGELTRNLLHNAIKHTPAGGMLTMTVTVAGPRATLRISDSGPGISVAQRQRLFMPFSSGSTTHDVGDGAGLGLTICHDIVQSLAGTIELLNREEGGRVRGLDAIVCLALAEPR